ncbi:MAG: LemA family protein [Planctomycetaceae bacterium]|nr:LemA family protein [Planctomycetaceae bacterium]
MLLIWTFLAGLGLLALVLLTGQAQLASHRNRCRQAWAGVDAQLRRHSELAGTIAATVEPHAGATDRPTLQRLADAREALEHSSGVRARCQSQRVLAGCLQDVLDLRNRHAALAVNIDLARQMQERAGVVAATAAAQRQYNEAAEQYDRMLKTLPASLVARMVGLKPQVRCSFDDKDLATGGGGG